MESPYKDVQSLWHGHLQWSVSCIRSSTRHGARMLLVPCSLCQPIPRYVLRPSSAVPESLANYRFSRNGSSNSTRRTCTWCRPALVDGIIPLAYVAPCQPQWRPISLARCQGQLTGECHRRCECSDGVHMVSLGRAVGIHSNQCKNG